MSASIGPETFVRLRIGRIEKVTAAPAQRCYLHRCVAGKR